MKLQLTAGLAWGHFKDSDAYDLICNCLCCLFVCSPSLPNRPQIFRKVYHALKSLGRVKFYAVELREGAHFLAGLIQVVGESVS